MSALRDRINAWVAETLANRAIIAPMPETELFAGRIKGLPSVAVVEATEGHALHSLEERLEGYANQRLAMGGSLPVWDKPPVEVSDDVRRCVRISTLRGLLKTRASQWGDGRQNLPAHAVDPILADFDKIITRHAMNLAGGGNLITL